MVKVGSDNCPRCGGNLRYYDTVKRVLISRYHVKRYIYIERYICILCGAVHRAMPDNVAPYKKYEKDVVSGVICGYITCETIGFEDHPCETTMIRWKTASRKFLTPL